MQQITTTAHKTAEHREKIKTHKKNNIQKWNELNLILHHHTNVCMYTISYAFCQSQFFSNWNMF